ncbi:MAG: EFR1 family ferrodoxin, partial [Clostridium sp.]
YFSSTGNGLYVGKKIKEKIDVELVSIPKCETFEIEDDFIGFIFPVHSFGLPVNVEEFIEKIKIKSENPYIFAVQVTGGGHTNNGFKFLNNELKKKGLKLSNYKELKYISNYTRAGKNPTEERAKEAIKNEEENLKKFIEDIENKKINEFTGKEEKLTNFIHKMWKEKYKKKDKNFNVNEKCISCSMCKEICPTKNIELEGGKPKWNGDCIDCMGCINICPKNAINIGEKTVKKNRYRNPYIDRKELY